MLAQRLTLVADIALISLLVPACHLAQISYSNCVLSLQERHKPTTSDNDLVAALKEVCLNEPLNTSSAQWRVHLAACAYAEVVILRVCYSQVKLRQESLRVE